MLAVADTANICRGGSTGRLKFIMRKEYQQQNMELNNLSLVLL